MWTLLFACQPDPPSLLVDFASDWAAVFSIEDADDRAGSILLDWDPELEEISGEVHIDDPDETRVYAVLDSQEVPPLGVALQLSETAGVRQMFIELAVPVEDAAFGGWRTQWGCAGQVCGETGGLDLTR